MISLTKLFTRQQLNLASECFKVASKRNVYTAKYLGLDAFKNYTEKIEREQGSNLASLKLTIEQSLDKPDGKVFTEDLKILLYLSRTDRDLDLLIKAIKKYQSQESLAIFNFNFESPLARLLTILNKVDLALDIFGRKNEVSFKNISKSRIIIMNKLFEEKRYNQVLELAELEVEDLKARNQNRKEGEPVLFNAELSNLIGHAAYVLNTPEAYNKAKKFFLVLKDLNVNVNYRGTVCLFLAALNQNDFDFAYEIASMKFRNQNNLNRNLKVVALCRLNRLDEALSEAKNFLAEHADQTTLFFNKTAIEELQNAVEKSNDKEKIAALDDLRSKLNNRIEKLDLKEFGTFTIDRNLQKDARKNNISNNRNRNFDQNRIRNFNENNPRNFNRAKNFDNQSDFQRSERSDGQRNNQNKYFRSNNQRVSNRDQNE